jgi:hypothetical protein
MTLFSYIYSAFRKKQYREPELLNILLRRLSAGRTFSISHSSVGWIVHYVVGLLFIISYSILWNFLEIEPSLMNCLVLGAISGLIGIAGWHITFRLHPHPPEINYAEYYFQLIIAHIVFGFGTYLALWV